jgi:hypothetical protein
LNPFKLLIWVVNIFISSDDDQKSTPDDNNTSALTQERSKTVDEK